MGHPQSDTPIKVENSTYDEIKISKIQLPRSRDMDTRFYWVINRVKQNHFAIFWRSGVRNIGDNFTKHLL